MIGGGECPAGAPGGTLRIELRAGSGPIAGVLTGDGAAPIEFSGWIQLAELIESQRLRLGDSQQTMERDGE